MLVALAVASSLLAPFHLPAPLRDLHFGGSGDVRRTVTHVAGWRLEIRDDRFTGQVSCRLRRGAMSAEHGVAVFRFSSGTDTANALVRIDDGAAMPAGDVGVEVAGLGAPLRTRNLKNPSDGRVALPLRLLANAHKVSIRPNPKNSRRDWRLDGLGAALTSAHSRGCDLEPPAPAPHV